MLFSFASRSPPASCRRFHRGRRLSTAPPSARQGASSQASEPSEWPSPIYPSTRLTLHKSVFEAHISLLPASLFLGHREGRDSASAGTHPGASAMETTRRLEPLFEKLERVSPRVKRATHCMYAWRIAGPTLLSKPTPPPLPPSRPKAKRGSPSSALPHTAPSPAGGPAISGSVSGGESGAGERLERLLELSPDCKRRAVVLVVYRWYGGVKLGSDRWRCISSVAKEALSVAAERGWK